MSYLVLAHCIHSWNWRCNDIGYRISEPSDNTLPTRSAITDRNSRTEIPSPNYSVPCIIRSIICSQSVTILTGRCWVAVSNVWHSLLPEFPSCQQPSYQFLAATAHDWTLAVTWLLTNQPIHSLTLHVSSLNTDHTENIISPLYCKYCRGYRFSTSCGGGLQYFHRSTANIRGDRKPQVSE
jgi:hypothetical protein